MPLLSLPRAAITALPLVWVGSAAAQVADGAAAGLGPWLFGTAALFAAIVAGAAGLAIGTLRSERRLGSALRGQQHESRLLAQLLDVWSWQTDATHRVRQMHPPVGAPAQAWATGAGAGHPLWDSFEVASASDVAGLRARLESQVPFSDLRVVASDGGAGWVLRAAPRFDDDGHFAGYTGTARPTDEDDARRTDQRALEALVEALPGPALVATAVGANAWTLRHANAEALRLLQGDAPPAALPWDQVLRRLPDAVRQALAAPAGTEPAPDPDGWLLRQVVAGPDGSHRALLLARAAPAPDVGGDSGDDSRRESESFSITVSHDLRAPIRVVEGFTRILKEDYGRQLDRVGNDHLDRVLGAAARMNHMIDALLTLARLSTQPLARQPVNLSQLAGFIVDDLRRGAPERVVETEVEAGLQAVGDPTLLRLVLENLIGNAWKYSARVKRARIVFGTETQDGRRVFVVRDNGAGFDMRSADRLFGLFQRLHSATDFPGTGVGLASVKRIVRRHGGDIWADAEPGRGAAFHFTLGD